MPACVRSNFLAAEPVLGQIEASLDGLPVALPAERHSIVGIRAYLEMLALEQQRILCSFTIDGQPANPAQPPSHPGTFSRVEAETIALDEVPLQILQTAIGQTAQAYARVESALALILINDARAAREIWWQIARDLKEPLLTLSLLPDGICGPAHGRASLTQLRKWQLEQLAAIIRDVDDSCRGEETAALSDALESRVLPWLQSLNESIGLWRETVAAGSRCAAECAA
jgi:hypothetical protein